MSRRRREYLTYCSVAATVALAGCPDGESGEGGGQPTTGESTPTADETVSGDDGGGWPTLQHDQQNTSHAPAETGPGEGVQQRWQYTVDGEFRAPSPALADDTLYLTDDSSVVALDTSDGRERWVRTVDEIGLHPTSTPQITDETVFVAGVLREEGFVAGVFALDRPDGTVRWQFSPSGDRPEGWRTGSPTYVGGTLYVPMNPRSGDERGALFAIDVESRSKQWEFRTERTITLTVAVSVDTVYAVASGVGSGRGRLYALDREQGQERWRVRTSEVVNAPTLVGDAVFLAPNAGQVVAHATADGSVSWRAPVSGFYGSPAVADGTVFVPTDRMFALRASDGETEWESEAFDDPYTTPAIADGTVYSGSNKWDDESAGRVVAFDAESGDTQWVHETETEITLPPIVADGTLYIGGQGTLYALEERT